MIKKTSIVDISINPRISSVCPCMRLGVVSADVVNSAYSEELWAEIDAESQRIASNYELLEINQRPAIAATRKLYKALGKDPNRYRVSSEALCRRIIRGLGLYQVDTIVDLVNLASIRSGYAIGGFDADKIQGNNLYLTVGTADDHYEGIGRGVLNIEGLPVYKDEVGGIGTPTSDEERTKMSVNTKRVLFLINAYAEEMPLEEMLPWVESLLVRYANATNVQYKILQP